MRVEFPGIRAICPVPVMRLFLEDSPDVEVAERVDERVRRLDSSAFVALPAESEFFPEI